jgi:hypothetical protein
VSMKSGFFWVISQRSRRFGVTYRLHHHGAKSKSSKKPTEARGLDLLAVYSWRFLTWLILRPEDGEYIFLWNAWLSLNYKALQPRRLYSLEKPLLLSEIECLSYSMKAVIMFFMDIFCGGKKNGIGNIRQIWDSRGRWRRAYTPMKHGTRP